MPLILGTNSIKDTGYDVANSCRFNDGSSDSLNRTVSSASNRRTFTVSLWCKRSALGITTSLIGADSGGGTNFGLQFQTNDTLAVFQGASTFLHTTQVFRDTSAWYHLVLAVDTTNSTADNRVRLYNNGTEITSFGTRNNPSVNTDLAWNNNVDNTVGADKPTSGLRNFWDGYLAEVVNIDGSQLAPTSFGEFDEDSGIWKPIDVSGLTFGTNGFYLDFENSGSLGADVSGNGNNFTVNNLTAADQSTDTCTNNGCTVNSVAVNTANIPTMSDGNLTALSTSGSNASIIGNMAVSSGIWYYELKWLSGTSGDFVAKVGWGNPDVYPNMHTASIVYRNSDGKKYIDNTGTSYGATWTSAGDIIGVLLDLDSGTKTIRFYKNDADQGAITLSGAIDDGTFFIPHLDLGNTDKVSLNFGSPPYAISSGNTDANGYGNFEFSTKGGYALNTKNLAEYG